MDVIAQADLLAYDQVAEHDENPPLKMPRMSMGKGRK
jgi:hypothetical protein